MDYTVHGVTESLQLQNGYDMPEISKVTGATLKEIREIAKSIK